MAEQRSVAFDPGFDELQLFEAMLQDKFVNHELDTIIKDVRIMRLLDPEDLGKYPGIRLYMGGWREAEWGIVLDREGTVGDKITKVILIQMYMFRNQRIEYFDKFYEGPENGLTVVREIVNRIVSENQRYSNEQLPGINFDFITPINELWFRNYLTNPDASALQIAYELRYQKANL